MPSEIIKERVSPCCFPQANDRQREGLCADIRMVSLFVGGLLADSRKAIAMPLTFLGVRSVTQ